MPTINSLDMESLRALSRALDTIKYQLRDVREQQARLNRESAPAAMYVCKTTSIVSGFDVAENEPGNGTAKIYSRRGTNTTLISGGEMTSTEQEFTVFNLSPASVATASFIYCSRDAFGDYWVVPGPVAKLAKNGETPIPGRVGTTPGSGTVSFYTFTGATVSGTQSEVTAYNMAEDEVAASAYLKLITIDGYWFVVWEECPSA